MSNYLSSPSRSNINSTNVTHKTNRLYAIMNCFAQCRRRTTQLLTTVITRASD